MKTSDALLACLPSAYDLKGPGVGVEVGAVAAVVDAAIASADDIRSEHQPDKAAQALVDWERNYGLPDSCCGGASAAVDVRRSNLMQRLGVRGDLSRRYYIDMATRLGYTGCTITELGPMRCDDPCNTAVNGPDMVGVWQLNIPVTAPVYQLTAESPCEAPASLSGSSQLECVIRRRKPAHTTARFNYTAS
jgi:uncharacterized protein YmfQ (DUF2313 family)